MLRIFYAGQNAALYENIRTVNDKRIRQRPLQTPEVVQ